MEYTEAYRRLTYETATLIFMKKNGDIRVMLCTRNMATIALHYGFQGKALGGHDNRCNIKNGNIAVFDLFLGEARSFHIDRLISVEWHGEIKTTEELDSVAKEFNDFKSKYEASEPHAITMDMLD